MDDEQSFAALLRSSTPASRPTWDAPSASGSANAGLGATGGISADPWANPFASSPPQPFAAPSIPRLPAVPDLPSPSFGSMSMRSPYDTYTANGTGGGASAAGGFGDNSGVMDDATAAFGGMDIAAGSSARQLMVEDQKESPYVQQLAADGITGNTTIEETGTIYTPQVDPPSVIAAREQEALDAQHAFSHDQQTSIPPAQAYSAAAVEPTMEDDPFAQPFASPSRAFTSPPRPVSPPIPPFTLSADSPPARAAATQSIASTSSQPSTAAMSPSKKLPAGLIDDDLLAASDPMLSLKKAFVKSTPAASDVNADESAAKIGKEADKGRSSPVPRVRHVDKAKKTFVFNAGVKKKPVEAKKLQAQAQPQPAELAPKPAEVEDEAKGKVNGQIQDEVESGQAEAGAGETVQAVRESGKAASVAEDQEDRDKGIPRAGGSPAPGAAVADADAKERKTEAAVASSSGEDKTAGVRVTAEGADHGSTPTPTTGEERIVTASAKTDLSESAEGKTRSTDTVDTAVNGQTGEGRPVANSDAAPVPPTGEAQSVSNDRRSLRPATIPLPDSTLTSPGLSRQVSPLPNHNSDLSEPQTQDTPAHTSQVSTASPSTIVTSPPSATIHDTSALDPVQTPYDRVAVSPLDAPERQASGFGFSSAAADDNMRDGDALARDAAGGWDESPLSGTTSQGRFSAKGWGAVDDLFGRKDDPWGGDESGQRGWDEAGPSTPAEPDYQEPEATSADVPVETASEPDRSIATPTSARQSPVKPRRKTHPVFTISIGDPTRVGDPVRGYTVYTIRTHTTSPHYRKSDLSALRRFSDFLWLVEALTANNPGIIIPPVPDKHTFGRFQEQFIETRRMALERSLTKITAHPVLQLDPDLRLFLESDNFSVESKARRPQVDAAPEQRGLLSGWTGPKFVESDDWFVSRIAFLDSLEAQLRGLSKAVEVSSKARLDYAIALGESAESMSRLAESDLGSAMCAALARLADLGRTEKETAEELAKGDVINLLNVADEYIRFIGSVRIAMQARTRGWFAWQSHVKEANRFKATREKMRAQGKLGDRAAQSLAEANELDRRAADAERDYETTSKVIKSEFARFERERVEEFKRALERWLDVQITRQKEVIEAWEEYHGVVLKMVQKAQGTRVPSSQ